MKEYLVDVPVRVNVWIRPEAQRKQFDVIKQARPSILFLVSDGPRNERERALLTMSRAIVEDIDWKCTVHKIYEEQNNGLYAMSKKGLEYIYNHVDRIIALEDDHIPAISFFRFCAELLEKYKDDERILYISGMNYLGHYDKPDSDYFFSSIGSVWGTAIWKRSAYQDVDLSIVENNYIKELFKESSKTNKKYYFARKYLNNRMHKTYLAHGEFRRQFKQITQNQLIIVPTKNMISNVGAVEDSANADKLNNLPRGIRKVFHLKTYEYDFPLKHPKYMMLDTYYVKKARIIMGFGYPHISVFRKIERGFLLIKNGEFMKFKNKIKKALNRNN